MGLTITPGYDFGLYETPNASKFGLQASGLTLQNVPLSSVDGTLLVINLFSQSGASTAPFEGSLWVDHQSNVWGRNRWGLVKARMFGGGIETNRFAARQPAALNPGWRVQLGDEGSQYTTDSCVAVGRSGVNGTPGHWIACETIPSGATSYFRIAIGPGLLPCYHLARSESFIGRKERLGNTPAALYFTIGAYSNLPTEGLEGDVMCEQTTELNGDTSATSSVMYHYSGLLGGRLEIT